MADYRSDFNLIERGRCRYIFIVVADEYCLKAREHRELFETLERTFALGLGRFGKVVQSSPSFADENYQRVLDVSWRDSNDAQLLRNRRYPKLLIIDKDFTDFNPYRNDAYAIIDFAEFKGIMPAVLDLLRQIEEQVRGDLFDWLAQRHPLTEEDLSRYSEDLGFPRNWEELETITQKEAAAILGITDRQVRNHLDDGKYDRSGRGGVYVRSFIRYVDGQD